MAVYHYLTIFALVIINSWCTWGINIRNVDTDNLIWAPVGRLKSPFVTFINDFNYPSWTTKDQVTKRTKGYSHLKLAKDVPFALVCGACFKNSISKPNLTIAISNHNSRSVSKKRGDKSFQYSVGINECVMTYLITEPIKKDGVITCTLNRGKQVIEEVVTFDAVSVKIEQPPEDYEIQNSESPIELTCPTRKEMPTRDNPNPIVNIWHEERKDAQPEKEVSSPILSTKPTLLLEQPRYTITIVCSVYNIFRPKTVQQRKYKIHGRTNTVKSEYHVSGDIVEYDADAEIYPPKINLSSSVLAIVIMAVIVCVLVGIIGLYRFFSAARK